MRLKYVSSWNFETYKGWEAICGQRVEGTVTWHSPEDEAVVWGDTVPGFGFNVNKPHKGFGEGFKTFEEAVEAIEKAIFDDA